MEGATCTLRRPPHEGKHTSALPCDNGIKGGQGGLANPLGLTAQPRPFAPHANAAGYGPTAGRISAASPVGRALLGRRKGEVAMVDVPKGRLTFKILDIGTPPESNAVAAGVSPS
jgi:Transcription elongation factor, GreA/GreB, C-term